MAVAADCVARRTSSAMTGARPICWLTVSILRLAVQVLLLAAFVLALPQTFAKNCSPVLPHSGLKFGTVRDAKL